MNCSSPLLFAPVSEIVCHNSMRTCIITLLTVFVLVFQSSCARNDSCLEEAAQAFKKRNPNYVIRSAKIAKRDERATEVALEFDAPDNAKNRGHADLSLRRNEEGSWILVEERVNMWTK